MKLTEEHHSQEAVGAGSPKAFKLANRFYKPALPTKNHLIDIGARCEMK